VAFSLGLEEVWLWPWRSWHWPWTWPWTWRPRTRPRTHPCNFP